jgi:hypothetical protein
MKTLKSIPFVVLCFGATFCVHGIELNNGVRQEFGMSFTEEQRTFLPIISNVVQTVKTQVSEFISSIKMRLSY